MSLELLDDEPGGFRRLLCSCHSEAGDPLVILAEISTVGEPALLSVGADLWRRLGSPRFLRVELTARDELARRAG